MRYKVIRRHLRGGKFYERGEHITAAPEEVARQVASGALEAFGSKADTKSDTKAESKADSKPTQ